MADSLLPRTTDEDNPFNPLTEDNTAPSTVVLDEQANAFPAGTTDEDRICWVCNGAAIYRHCKIICQNCGFTRDCSDP